MFLNYPITQLHNYSILLTLRLPGHRVESFIEDRAHIHRAVSAFGWHDYRYARRHSSGRENDDRGGSYGKLA